jgi:chromosome segregation ATPase
MLRVSLLFFILLQCALFSGQSAACAEIAQLEEKIQSNRDTKDLLIAKIVKLEDQADRWQVRTELDYYQQARRSWQQADMLKDAVVELDAYTQQLEDKKAALLKEHPECAK